MVKAKGSGSGKVRLGIVGVSGIGVERLKNALATPEAEVTALADVNAEALKGALAQAPNAQGFDDAAKLFKSKRCDAVLLNVPHFLHGPFALQALESGLHVLAEKPMAIRVTECDEMIAAAKAAGLKLSVHHQHRHRARSRARILREGGLGRLLRATFIRNSRRTNAYYRTADWRGKWKTEGGGVLINQSIHDIDEFLQYTGLPCEVRASLHNLVHDVEVEDGCVAALSYPDGAVGTFVTNLSSLSPTDVCEFECERGILQVSKPARVGRLPGRGVYGFFDDSTEMWGKPPKTEWEDLPEVEPFAPGSLVRDFCLAIQEDRAPFVDAQGARDAVAFFNALVVSHFLAKPARLPLDPTEVDGVFDDLAKGRWKLDRRFTASAKAELAGAR